MAKPKESDETLPAVQKGGAVAAAPSFMQDKQGAGTDHLDTKDMEVPRIKLIQAISPEVTEHTNAMAGEFWHTLAEESFGRKVSIVPIYIDKRFILWRPRKAGGGILARADDGTNWNPPNTDFTITLPETKKNVTWRTGGDIVDEQGRVTAKNVGTVAASGLDQWGSYDPDNTSSQPAATLMYTMVVAMPDYPDYGFAQLTLQRGSVSVAKNLIAKLKLNSKPSYGRVFSLESVEDQNSSGDPFFNFRFTADGYVQNEDAYNAYEALYKQFSRTGLNIKDIDSLQGEEEAAVSANKSTKNY